jgi:hypothetical protein
MNKHVIHWKKGSSELFAFGRVLPCSCDVRNEVNGRRHADQVRYSIPDKKPYQPRQFPKGTWKIQAPVERTDPDLAPWFIPTDAWQDLPIWELKDGKYFRATDKKTRDRGYGLHYSVSSTTLGCIKIQNRDDLIWLVDKISEMLAGNDEIYLEVT